MTIKTNAPIPHPETTPILSVEDAGALLGLGRSSAYAAAKKGEIPTIQFGKKRVVPTAKLRQLLGL